MAEFLVQPLAVAAAVLLLTLVAVIHRRLNPLNLPPGPPKDSWIFGNAIPKALCVSFISLYSIDHADAAPCRHVSAYRKFEEWTQEYGPLFSLRQGPTTIIVVGRLQATIDIMEREGAALVDRPVSISAGETLSGGMRVLLTPAGERFKKMRR